MKVSPSLLSANFACLERDIDMINRSEADLLHLDVMDGVFVPNISFGFPVINAIAPMCQKPLDTHLMIVEPQNYISQVRDTGASIMTVHYEACTHLHRVVQQIRNAGMLAGVALNPATPVSLLVDILSEIDLVLVMSVNPGFGGQKFIERALDKVSELRRMIDQAGVTTEIEVDGGVNADTGARLAAAGADIVVAGNYVFKNDSPIEAINTLKAM